MRRSRAATLDAREIVASVSETSFMATVIELAEVYGWLWYHTHDSRRSEPGFPDLCLVRDGRCLLLELKAEDGRVSKEQRQWLKALEACPGVETAVYRPSDWSEIERMLSR